MWRHFDLTNLQLIWSNPEAGFESQNLEVCKTYIFINSYLSFDKNWKQNQKITITAVTLLLWVKVLFRLMFCKSICVITCQISSFLNNSNGFWTPYLKLVRIMLQTSKRLEWGQFLIFPKMYFQKRGWNPEFFVTFNLWRCQLKLHISWKRHWNSSNRSENMKTFSANISYFRQFVSFHQFFGFFDITCCKETNQLIKDNVSIFFFTFNLL